MTLKSLVLTLLPLMALQCVVIFFVTRANKEYFDRRKALEYGHALRDLAKDRPLAALTIKLCNGLYLVELLAVIFAKYVLKVAA